MHENRYSDESPQMSMIDGAPHQPIDWDRIHPPATRGATTQGPLTMPAPTHFPVTPRSAFGFDREIVPQEYYRGADDDPFSDHHSTSKIGLAVTTLPTEDVPEHHRSESRVSEAPSSPSIYPPSLPGDQLNSSHAQPENIADPGPFMAENGPFDMVPLSQPDPLRHLGASKDTLRPTFVVEPPSRVTSPPRPPRSELRSFGPAALTPPTSIASHSRGHTNSPSGSSGSDHMSALQLSPLFDEKVLPPPGPVTHEPEVFLRRTYSKRTPMNHNVRLQCFSYCLFGIAYCRHLSFRCITTLRRRPATDEGSSTYIYWVSGMYHSVHPYCV